MATNRHPVAQGGMWSAPKVTYSKETQNLLKDMMRESKLTNFQQRQLDKAMKDGTTLPKSCHPTSSAKPRQPPPKKESSKTVDPRTEPIHMRCREAIEDSGAYEREEFKVQPLTKYGGFYEKDKARLANIMAYGEDLPPPDKKKVQRKMAGDDLESRVDRFDELQKEIEERQKFLDKMEELGQGDKYRNIIATEISQKIREMEVIDRKRTALLNQAIAQREKVRAQQDKTMQKTAQRQQKGSSGTDAMLQLS